jgi:hypothetical protein
LIGANLNTTATSLKEGNGQVGGLVLTEEGYWIGEAALIGEVMRIGEKAYSGRKSRENRRFTKVFSNSELVCRGIFSCKLDSCNEPIFLDVGSILSFHKNKFL